MTLPIAEGFDFPDDIITARNALMGTSGGGKSNAAVVLAEAMFHAGLPWVAIDPKGDWWGIRSNKAGNGPGLSIPVFGGLHGDMPLAPSAGALMARLVIERNMTCILDVSDFDHRTQQVQFAVDFARELLKLIRRDPRPLHLFIDEAEEFCVSSDTQILTRSGFASWDEIKEGDEVAAFNPASGECQWEAVERLISYRYQGPMVRLKTSAVDSLTTPDHRVVIRRTQRATGRTHTVYPWAVVKAADVPTNVFIPTPRPVGQPGEVAFAKLELLRIAGWMVTDGFVHDRRVADSYWGIEQSTDNSKGSFSSVVMGDVFRKYGINGGVPRTRMLNGTPHRSTSWYIGGRLGSSLAELWQSPLGYKSERRIPRHLIEQSSLSELESLFTGLLEGDGHWAREGRGWHGWSAFTPGVNEGLADDFQEIATLLGISTTKAFVPTIGQWRVSISHRTEHCIRKPSREDYDGLVWCVTVPSGAFVARRNGRTFVTGNCPQVPGKEGPEPVMIGLYSKMCKQGRAHGLGVTLLSQRSASLNKNALSQTMNLVVFLTTDPRDQKQVLDWIADPVLRAEVKATLSALEPGEAWVLSPGFLKRSERVKWLQRTTFDSGETPKVGQKLRRTPVTLADIDLTEIATLMAATVEHAEADDPDKLRATIDRLRRQIADGTPADDARVSELEAIIAELRAHPIEVPIVPSKLITTLVNTHGALLDAVAAYEGKTREMVTVMGEVLTAVKSAQQSTSNVRALPLPPDESDREPSPPPPRRRLAAVPTPLPDGAVKLGKTERKILTVLATHPNATSLRQVAIHTGYSPKASTIPSSMSKLRKLGFATPGPELRATPEGIAALGDIDHPPEGPALLDYWHSKIGKTERALLAALLDAYPEPLSLHELADVTGYSAGASTIPSSMSKLRGYQLVSGWKVTDEFARAIQ